jgi:8-oxo-dGTP pyrophosphatase MutT (NUDIX family)
MGDIIQSAGGIVYYLASDGSPRYLLIKRHALSGKIEWVSPKGKLQGKESLEQAALREVSEETGLPINQLRLK